MSITIDIVTDLLAAYPHHWVNCAGEFIANEKWDFYFNLRTCKDDMEIGCKVLEWFSRPAYKDDRQKVREYMTNGLESFFHRAFTRGEIETIYTHLGNKVNRDLTLKFLESGFDMKVLEPNWHEARRTVQTVVEE